MKAFSSILFSIVLLAFPLGCSDGPVQLNGAGATFPYVIYSKWFDLYHQKTGVQFNYQSIGSGSGIKQVIEGTVDFGATDGPMKDEQLAEARQKRGTEILHIPTILGAVVLTYNAPEVGAGLRLTGEVVVDIFMGKIKKWNDPTIAASNPGKTLPSDEILVVHRSDGSGTSFIFTDYLSKVSNAWESKVGRGTSVSWPTGLGAKGNEGVAGVVKQTKGSIGYVELAYVVQNKLPYVSVMNKAGNFVEPTIESVTAAAADAISNMPEDMRVSITNPDGAMSYPISGFTWLLIYRESHDKAKGKALVDFLRWAMGEGQSYAADLLYAPLPKEVIAFCGKKIDSIVL